ncbi:MAG: metallophosphoesterase [Endomicrobium sp.]|nr:metallophosphoesterase [Endomicrobium sp.]
MPAFFAFFFVLYGGAGVYCVWRINAVLKFKNKLYPYAFVILAGLLTTAAYIAGTYDIKLAASVLGRFGSVWMGIAALTSSCLLANDFLNLLFYKFRRAKFRYYSMIASLCIAAILILWSLANAAFILKIKTIELEIPNLKADKLSVVLLSDLHITRFTSPKNINNIVSKVNALNPDIIVFAGDIIDCDISENYALYGLDKFKSKYGVFAVTGNHEYYAGVEIYEKLCKNLGVKLLRNENFTVENVITVAGVNDIYGQKAGIDLYDPAKAFEGISAGSPVLFLSHRPGIFNKAAHFGFNIVQLSGHTHAGQIIPAEIIIKFFKYGYGLFKTGDSYMYLTSGTRFWGPPMRTLSSCEITKIILKRSNK